MGMSPAEAIKKLSGDEYQRLIEKAMTAFNQPFEIIDIDRRGKRPMVLIKLSNGLNKTMVL